MTYHITTTLDGSFDAAIDKVTAALQAGGFGIMTQIDVTGAFKQKLDVDFRNYRILGACAPALARRVLEAEPRAGTMLPCNVVVQETAPGRIEVSAIDPVASMQAIGNPALVEILAEVRSRLQQVIAGL